MPILISSYSVKLAPRLTLPAMRAHSLGNTKEKIKGHFSIGDLESVTTQSSTGNLITHILEVASLLEMEALIQKTLVNYILLQVYSIGEYKQPYKMLILMKKATVLLE